MNQSEFHQKAEVFLQHLFAQLKDQKVELQAHWSIDHLCFRVQSVEAYHSFKNDFSSFARMLVESEVNGRLIATFKLQDPIHFQGYAIGLVELPAPKAGKHTPEGFEHIEVVVDQPLQQLKTAYAGHRLDEGGLKKPLNQDLEIEMQDCAVKFHPLSLESVIALEKNQKVYQALVQSGILEILKPFDPLLAGAFPLGLAVENSGLDILLCAQDLSSLASFLVKHFASFAKFQTSKTQVDGVETLLAGFEYEDVPFEIFAQKTESIRQTAYLHFQAEEKLLKLGGESLRQKVKGLRRQGLKTEPAFAKSLNLDGDPYQVILQLQKMSELELINLIAR